MDRGTLYQLKILINRSSVPSQPDKDMKAAEDFLDVVIHALVMAAAGMLCNQREINSVAEMAGGIFKTYINLQLGKSTSVPCNDGIYLYACDLLMLGMIWMGFHDATREGDGERVLTYWKFLLPIFKVLGRKNYSIEAVQMQLQNCHYLSERQSAQLTWSRFVNTHGRKGTNIPCDLHLEHLNRRLKTSIRNLGSNIKGSTVVRAAKTIGVVNHICDLFEEKTTQTKESDKHSVPSFYKDFQMILTELTSLQVFTIHPGRQHSEIVIKKLLLEKFSQDKYLDWVQNHIH